MSYLQKEDALKLWGEPSSFADVASLFVRFCTGELSALPWSDQALAKETSVISSQLAKMNELGFLTINSQPAVNGASSTDTVFGWGPSNGYVYQKAGAFPSSMRWATYQLFEGLSGVLRTA